MKILLSWKFLKIYAELKLKGSTFLTCMITLFPSKTLLGLHGASAVTINLEIAAKFVSEYLDIANLLLTWIIKDF